MLSYETEEDICKIFMIISEAECKCEIARKNLNQMEKFNPYKIFKRIDNDNTNYITDSNLIDFFQSNQIYCTNNEAKFIISFYDSNSKKCLNYSQFLNIIIENDNENILLNKNEDLLDSDDKISYQIEYALCRLFEKEINLVRNLEFLISDLKERRDFSIFDMFYLLKNESNEISQVTLSKFLKSHDINFNDDDIMRILKRCDVDKNLHITMEDIQKIFGIETCYPCFNYLKNQLSFNEEYINISTKSPQNIFTDTNYSTIYYSNDNNNNEEQKNQNEEIIKKKISDNLLLTQIPQRKKFQYKNININQDISNNFKVEYNISENSIDVNSERIIQFLKLIMICELQIEKAKIELSKRAEFNIDDIFRFFEPKHFEYVTQNDLVIGLSKLKIFTTDSEIKLLLMKYDLNNNGVLEFEDFFDMFIPFEREFRYNMEKRTPLPFVEKFNKGYFLTDATLPYLKNVLNIMIKSECKIEEERHKLNKNFNLDYKRFYRKIDKDDKGYFGIMDLKYFFYDSDIKYLPKEIDLLFIRLDKKRNGEVDYKTFLNEIINRVDSSIYI